MTYGIFTNGCSFGKEQHTILQEWLELKNIELDAPRILVFDNTFQAVYHICK